MEKRKEYSNIMSRKEEICTIYYVPTFFLKVFLKNRKIY